MTTADDDRRDELASALLDGDLPADEATAARRDPAVVARAAELAAARDRLREVPPPSAAARESGLAAALAVFDGEGRPAPLAARRERRGIPAWLGAAATVAVLAGVVGLLALGGGLGGSSSSSDSGETLSAADEAPASPVPESDDGGAQARESSAALVVDLGDLGDFATADALTARVAATRMAAQAAPGTAAADGLGADESATTTSPGAGGPPATVALPGGFSTCSGADLPEAAVGGQSGVLAHAAARLAGTHVDVWLVQTEAGTRMVALDTSCRVVADRPVD
jgi:hypothetical protein